LVRNLLWTREHRIISTVPFRRGEEESEFIDTTFGASVRFIQDQDRSLAVGRNVTFRNMDHPSSYDTEPRQVSMTKDSTAAIPNIISARKVQYVQMLE
jgi:hypothetical protein